MTRPIIVSSNLIVDDVWLADGCHAGEMVGGAALWAAIGARYFWPDVAMVSGVGADFEMLFGAVIDQFDLQREGHLIRDAHTIRSKLIYEAEDSRTETPVFGAAHFEQMQVSPAQTPAALRPATGAYVFRDLWPQFWEEMRAMRSELGVVLWELQGDVAAPAQWETVRAHLPLVDVFSCNLAEARALIGAATAAEAAQLLVRAGAPIAAIRDGGNGAIIATQSACLHVLPVPTAVVDVTGGGNAFCGGLLAGICHDPNDIRQAARKAAAAAGMCIAQQGPPPHLDPAAAAAIAGKVVVQEVM